MSRLSIYETRWIDLIFENRNQEYGAYQLRRDSVKTSVTALFIGLLFVASVGVISTIVSNFNTKIIPDIKLPEWKEPLQVTQVDIQDVEKPAQPIVQSQATETTIVKDQLINPIIVQSTEVFQEVATNKENTKSTDVVSDGTGIVGLNTSSSVTGTDTAAPIDYGTTLVNTTALDKMPEFPGGINKFYNYVGNNFEKPEIETINRLKIYVSFVIEKDGSMTDIRVLRDPGYGLGSEAIRVLKSLKTKWSPGMINAKPVRTSYNLPIVIDMQ